MAETTVATMPETKAPSTREEKFHLVPPVDIAETEDGLVVAADLPGVDKDDVSIRVENDMLTIQGRTNHSIAGTELRTEFRLMNFFRQFTLGQQVDQEGITADIKQGVLTIHIPRRKETKPKQIQVNIA